MSLRFVRPEWLARYTSIGRVVDPALPTHRLLLLVMFVTALARTLTAWSSGLSPLTIGTESLLWALTVFGCWALARELSVDHPWGAFLSAGLGIGWLFFGPEGASVLLLLTTLLQVRIVNRTAGPPAKISDGLAVVALTLGSLWITESPIIWGTGALAFLLDALGRPRTHRSWVFALMCTAGGIIFGMQNAALLKELAFLALPQKSPALFIAIGALYLFATRQKQMVDTRADATGAPLSAARIRWGMGLALVAATLPLFGGFWGLCLAGPLWTTLAAVALVELFSLFSPRG